MEKYNLEQRVRELFQDLIFTNKMEEGEIEELIEGVKDILKEVIKLDRRNVGDVAKITEADSYPEDDYSYVTRYNYNCPEETFVVSRTSITSCPLPEGIEED